MHVEGKTWNNDQKEGKQKLNERKMEWTGGNTDP